ncbi:hypothetical protein FAES_0852 [Fibrella aestuarina BUZ 2]|uniref:Uncharacterized protein n=1 Tax=Fibrella aestuarina BUZ 2 TaxID=1166018 RepID=I0K410_9BACT|nr:hypothetical protein [Fibrella aestuarina]CCG98863.1 hypothetical protein FAES_0852 [Fibrella aestuarina BUZ 2]
MLPSSNSSVRLRQLRRPLLLLAILIGFACAGGDEGEFWSLFQPETANTQPDDRLYAFTPLLYNTDYSGFDDGATDDSLSNEANVKAWTAYLGNGYTADQVEAALADSAAGPLVARLAQTNAPAATYLRFAYEAQAASAHGSAWERVPGDTTQLRSLATKARQQAQTAADPFLKERYAFQAVKLADEAGEFARSREAYDQLVGSLSKRTFISDWARARQAGALLSLGEKDRALFEFAQVFANCPSRRHAAERSIRMGNLHFTEGALKLAKTDAERVAIYAICAIQPKQDGLPLLEKMVALDPKHPLNELVLTREINRNEYYAKQTRWTGYVDAENDRTDSLNFESRRTSVADYNQKLLAFAEGAAKNTALGNPALYLTAAAYLHYLAGDYTAAKTTLDEAAKQPTSNSALKQQIALQQMLLLSAQPDVPEAPTETQFVSYLTQFQQNAETRYDNGAAPYNFRFANALSAAGLQMADRYLSGAAATSGGWLSSCSSKKKAETVNGPNAAKAFLMRVIAAKARSTNFYGDDQLTLEDSTDTPTAQAVADFVTKPSGEFDERLAKLAGFDADVAYQLLGRRNIAVGNYEAAALAFAKVSPKAWASEAYTTNLTVDPFTVNFPDEGKPASKVSPLQFVQRLADLQTKAKQAAASQQRGDVVAQLHYELGCGAYNLSYWGNAWILNRRARSSAEPLLYGQTAATFERILQDPYYVNTIALHHFEQAAQLAQSPELAAKATYLAARCQHDALRVRREIEKEKTGTYVDDEDPAFNQKIAGIARAEYDSSASVFRQRFRSTRFAQDMLTNCALYKDVVQ